LSIKIKELPEEERPYEKLELYGEKRLTNAELLAIIIKTGTSSETSVQLAQKILGLKGKSEKLDFLAEISIEELMTIKGIGKVKAIQLKAVCELAKRMSVPSNYKRIIVRTPDDIADILMNQMKFEKREIVKLVILNSKNEVLKISDISVGGTEFNNLEIKDIMIEPIKMSAPKIILAHNHPSGDCTPSNADIIYTNKLFEAARLLEIDLLDHLVIGNMKYTSIFSEMVSKKEFQNNTL